MSSRCRSSAHRPSALDYGVTITTGPLTGLLARAIVIINADGKVVYTELVPEIAQEPDYHKALSVLP